MMGTYYRCPVCDEWVIDKTADEHREEHPTFERRRIWNSIRRRLRRARPQSLRLPTRAKRKAGDKAEALLLLQAMAARGAA